MRTLHLATLLIVLGGTIVVDAKLSQACSKHGTNSGGNDWLGIGNSGGIVDGLLSLETSLIAPTSPTTCTAGMGLGSLSNPLPVGVNVTDMAIVLVNTTSGSRTPLSEFPFAPNGVTTAALTAGSGSSTVPDTNPLVSGATWFGFSASVNPLVLPVLGPDEFFAFQFHIELPEALAPLLSEAQYAGGEGMADGTPIFTGVDPVQYFAATDPSVTFVPEPGSLMLLAIGAVLLVSKSGRSQRPTASSH